MVSIRGREGIDIRIVSIQWVCGLCVWGGGGKLVYSQILLQALLFLMVVRGRKAMATRLMID